MNVSAGSGLAPGSTLVVTGDLGLADADLTPPAAGLNVVGGAGFAAATVQQVTRVAGIGG